MVLDILMTCAEVVDMIEVRVYTETVNRFAPLKLLPEIGATGEGQKRSRVYLQITINPFLEVVRFQPCA